MGASCCLVGATINDTAMLSGSWGFGWGLSFLNDLKTATAAVEGMRYIEDRNVRNFIANGVKHIADKIFKPEEDRPGCRPLSEQYEEEANRFKNKSLRTDEFIYINPTSKRSYSKINIGLHCYKEITDSDEKILIKDIYPFDQYNNIFWTGIINKINSIYALDTINDDIVLSKYVYNYIICIFNHLKELNINDINLDTIKIINDFKETCKKFEQTKFDEVSMNEAINFISQMIKTVMQIDHHVFIKFLFGTETKYISFNKYNSEDLVLGTRPNN